MVASNVSSPSRFVKEGQTVAATVTNKLVFSLDLKQQFYPVIKPTAKTGKRVENKLCPHKHQHTSCCLGDAFKIPLQNPSHCHGPHVYKVLEAHVVDTAGGEDNVSAGCQDFLDPLLGDVRLSEKERKKK